MITPLLNFKNKNNLYIDETKSVQENTIIT